MVMTPRERAEALKTKEIIDEMAVAIALASSASGATGDQLLIDCARQVFRVLAPHIANAIAEDRRELLANAAALVEAVCVPDCAPEFEELAEQAADAFNAGGMKRPMHERLKDFGGVIASALRTKAGV